MNSETTKRIVYLVVKGIVLGLIVSAIIVFA